MESRSREHRQKNFSYSLINFIHAVDFGPWYYQGRRDEFECSSARKRKIWPDRNPFFQIILNLVLIMIGICWCVACSKSYQNNEEVKKSLIQLGRECRVEKSNNMVINGRAHIKKHCFTYQESQWPGTCKYFV